MKAQEKLKAKYVIIGNSAAAVGGVEGIRAVEQKEDIILVSSEPHFTYSRPLISYLLGGQTDMQRIKYRLPDFYKQNNAALMAGRCVGITIPVCRILAVV